MEGGMMCSEELVELKDISKPKENWLEEGEKLIYQ